jgi:hypothetical protein
LAKSPIGSSAETFRLNRLPKITPRKPAVFQIRRIDASVADFQVAVAFDREW